MLDDVLGALGAAHAAGVLHRDIKPGNILFAHNGSAMKVADFGIAKTAATAQTTTGQILGTMAYMSPQRVAGAPASVADDLYAVGVIAHEALSGRRSFPQENPMSLMRAILDDPPPPIEALRSDVDPNLAVVINRAMSRDERTTFRTALEMRSALAGVAVPSRPSTKVLEQPMAPSTHYLVPPRPTRRPMTRRRKLLLAAAAFIGLLVATLALAFDPASTTQLPEPVSSSTAVPPPPPLSSPPSSPAPVPVVDEPQRPPKKKPNGNGNGKH
jgi:serine/threonine-protein kinase